MAVADPPRSAPQPDGSASFAPSPAGPVAADTPIDLPPSVGLPRAIATLRFLRRPLSFKAEYARRLGDTFQVPLAVADATFTFTSHPDHVRSLFTAKPADVPSLTAESPLRPILGPNSVLTANGSRHMRQRKLLLPPFHGEAVQSYVAIIREVIEAEVDRWPVGEPFPLAPAMQSVTLDVIMAGVFGIEDGGAPGSNERAVRDTVQRFLAMSTRPWWAAVDAMNLGRTEPRGPLKWIMDRVDEAVLTVIAERRAAGGDGTDIMTLLLSATDEAGVGLSDREIRDELLTLVLAGHETTANTLAWAFERLVRVPAAYDALRDSVRAEQPDREYVDATVYEAMRNRPVIPMVGRLVQKPWRLGEYVIPAGSPVSMSITLLHHRPDVYPDPFVFRPERFVATKPGTYTWIPFGGGTRRCLGAALALAELREVLEIVARRTDMEAVTPAPEKALHRNVTLIPEHGGTVVVRAKR